MDEDQLSQNRQDAFGELDFKVQAGMTFVNVDPFITRTDASKRFYECVQSRLNDKRFRSFEALGRAFRIAVNECSGPESHPDPIYVQE